MTQKDKRPETHPAGESDRPFPIKRPAQKKGVYKTKKYTVPHKEEKQ